MPSAPVLRKRALLLEQDADHPIYLFALTAEEILKVAEISRISRDDGGRLIGYQRPEVRRHIDDIVEYLNGDKVLFPNSIILALSSSIEFKRSRGPQLEDSTGIAGILEIPLPGTGMKKPGWIVDGQQRTLALARSKRKDLTIPVNAFIADEIELQRDQFLRVNSVKPLPRGLITELLPEVQTILPSRLASRKIPSVLCDFLNRDSDSPFHGLIKRTSTSKPDKKKAVITDTSVIKMLEESLSNPMGCLFPCRNLATGETDSDSIRKILYAYWGAVKRVFPEAWGKTPHQSRLMHGTGIRAMGRLMDKVMSSKNLHSQHLDADIEKDLRLMAPYCRWTSGAWEELGGLKWNEVQNVPKHISLLSNNLIRTYLAIRENRA